MNWSHRVEYWSGFLERNLGGKFWSGTENAVPVMKESVAVFKGILLHSIKTRIRGWVRKFCHRCYITINIHDWLLNYISLERATFLLYNDTKPMPRRNKYFKLSVLKDRWGKTTGVFS